MPADTPIMTLDTAFGASFSGTEEPATDITIDTYTGWKNAGITRVIRTTGKFVANAEITLHTVNTLRTSIIAFFLFTPEKKSGIVGPDTATTSANILTSRPAAATVTP